MEQIRKHIKMIIIGAVVIALIVVGVIVYNIFNTPRIGDVSPEIDHSVFRDVVGEDLGIDRNIHGGDEIAEGRELFCICDSEEMARKIAEDYDIILVSYEQSVATFTCDRDPKSVIEWGIEHGLKELSLNRVQRLL